MMLTTDGVLYLLPPLLYLEEQETQDTFQVQSQGKNYAVMQSKKERCCHVVQGGPHLTQHQQLAFLRDSSRRMQEKACFCLPWSYRMITILNLGTVKASEQERPTRAVTPQLLRENMTKTAGFGQQSTFGTFYYNLDSSIR